jgi:hypothetical protein
VNNIIINYLAAVPALALAAGTALAQDLAAGRRPAQLFAADCSACPRSPHGLGKKHNTGSLTGFLRTHYTTTPETAGLLAKYIMASRPVAASPTAKDQTSREPTELVEDLNRTLLGWANYFEAGTRLLDGKHSDLSNGGEKPKPTGKPNARAAAPQPATPGVQQIATPPAPQPAVDSATRLHAYATSGAGAEETAADAPKLASGKSHHRADGEVKLTPSPAETGEPAAAEVVTGSTPEPAPIAGAAEKSSDNLP